MTPALPDEIPAERLAELARTGIEARLPGCSAEVTAAAAERHAPWDFAVTLTGLGRMPLFSAIETTAFVIGELTVRAKMKTGRLTITDSASGQRVVLLTRDARQLWRERMGLATPVPKDSTH